MRRLLIIGCGDVALRVVSFAGGRYRIFALVRSPNRLALLRARGVTPVRGDLDHPETLDAIAGLAHDVVHLAPPPPYGIRDTRTAHLAAALAKGGSLPQRVVYLSTSGVYGDCAGAFVAETRPVRPQTDRARRRADAERQLRSWGARSGVRVAVLRVPGIYAPERLPLARLRSATPALKPEDDAYINHVHADDLARMVLSALHRSQPNRSYNASDDAPQRMGDYFDLVADRFGLARPPRISRDEAAQRLPGNLLSFMGESRRLVNRRIKEELRLRLLYPSVAHGLHAASLSVDGASAAQNSP
jgi:nucleoside-diphosphate-sugar epimerase